MPVVWNTPTPSPAGASGIEESLSGVKKAAVDQMAWNRPNTANPWASQNSNADGSVSLGFTGPLAGAQKNLTAEALRNLGSATDFNQLNVGSGDDFRARGIAGAQGQMNDWLSPLQGGFDNADKQRLLAAGFQEGTPQFQAQMGKGGAVADDLRSSLGNAAIGMGAERGARMQGMDLLSKQQGLAEALRKRSLPMEQLSAMNGLLGQPGYSPDGSIMAGASMDFDQAMGDYWGKRQEFEAQQKADQEAGIGAGLSLFQTAATLGMGGMGGLNPKSTGGQPGGKGPMRYI